MKKLIVLCGILVAGSHLNAQTIFEKWEELNAYHQVMSKTFHPAEEGNLEPVKSMSKDLSEQALKLSQSKIPLEFDKELIRKAVVQLNTDSKALYEKVESSSATDKELKESIFALHDVFHQIVGLCKEEHHE